jgi:pimeloyl-ACP methyl ester carboxylesterase
MDRITDYEEQQISAADASDKPPVMFVHGLWLLPSSWDRWRARFEEAGYATLAPGWPQDPETLAEARENPQGVAGESIKDVADHYASIVGLLRRKPVVIGHSFGGLLTEILAGRGLAAASVAISPAPFRGVLPLPFSALRAASPALGNPLNYHRAVPLTFDQFRYAFANAVTNEEAQALYDAYAVPADAKPLFQAAAANLNPWTEDKVDTQNPERGPMLIIAGEKDHTVPVSVAMAAYNLQRKNESFTDFTEMPGRGHALTIDSGAMEVATVALRFVERFVPGVTSKGEAGQAIAAGSATAVAG